MPERKNTDIRLTARQKGISLWQVAEALNVSEMTLYRWLRFDLEPEKRERILEAIDNVAAQLYGERSKTQ